MERGQLIAALVAILAVGGLLAVRVGAGSEPVESIDVAAPAGEPDGDGSGNERSDEGETTASTADSSAGTVAPAEEAPDNLGPAGTLRELDGWLQTDATSFEDFDGQVRIVQFWTSGCYNCHNTFPSLQRIYERWHPEGLEIIGVHAPEFDWEKEVDAIAAAAVDNGVIWPIALDTEKTNFRDWQPGRRFWPRTFVVDQNGDVRFDHIGEGRYDELADTVAYLVENGP